MNDKWMESGFMLIQQVAHLAKYQTLKEMESCGLKPNQAGILVVLRSEGGLSQKELAKRMGVTPPSMTAALKKMEKQGYVLREQDEKDQTAENAGKIDLIEKKNFIYYSNNEKG